MLIRRPSHIYLVSVANSTGAYAAGQQIGVPVEIKNAAEASGAAATLVSIIVLDPAKTDQPVDLFFFAKQPTGSGADKVAATITAADLPFLLGAVSVTSFKDLASVSAGMATSIGLKLKPLVGTTSVWMMAVARGTQNYAGTSNLNFQVGIDRD